LLRRGEVDRVLAHARAGLGAAFGATDALQRIERPRAVRAARDFMTASLRRANGAGAPDATDRVILSGRSWCNDVPLALNRPRRTP